MKYNIEQEEEADEIAIQALEILGYDKNALASALNRMRSIMEQERSHVMYFQSYTHPALVKRIQDAGKPQDISSSDFEREMSFAVTSTARMKFEDRRFRQVLPLVEQNINNGVATSEDYILKAHCLLSLYNDPQSNTEVLNMVNMAKSLDESNVNIYKAEILANLRLEKHIAAQELLSQYIQRLNEMELSLKEIESDRAWDNTHNFISTERDWAKRMIVKVRAMQ
jgi:predicted Zn-dependent protease